MCDVFELLTSNTGKTAKCLIFNVMGPLTNNEKNVISKYCKG